MKTRMCALLLFVAPLSCALASAGVWANTPTPQAWGITCFDNNCVWISGSYFASGKKYSISTIAPDGSPLGSYSATSVSSTITFRPNSIAELQLLSSREGLQTLVSSPENSTPILALVAMKAVTATSVLSQNGHSDLLIDLNGNPAFHSPFYSVTFLNALNRQPIAVAQHLSTNNALQLSIDLSSFATVSAAYHSEGVFLQISNADGRQLSGEYFAHAGSFGMLDRFYRATQLQDTWTLLVQNLIDIQSSLSYLLAPKVDVPYLPKFGAHSIEVPFADSFVITHFLGGNTKADVEPICGMYPSYCHPIEPWSLDYIVPQNDPPNQQLLYQTDLVYDRLNPYLQAGYQPSDITIGLDNVPWAIASNAAPENDSACVPQLKGSLGFYGQCNPPANFQQWSQLVSHLTNDLTAAYGSAAAQFSYEVGDEFEDSSTYDSGPQGFYSLYQNAFQAVHTTFPNATVVPGDLVGSASCRYPYFVGQVIPGCTYDGRDFLLHELAQGMAPDYVPRSANSFWDLNLGITPSAAASSVISSYAYIETGTEPVIPEIHQFGFLDMPFGPVGDDTSSLSANWDFQLLLRLKQALLKIRRIFNWGGIEEVSGTTLGNLDFLNGNGWIRMLFDNLQGSELYLLPVSTKNSLPVRNEVMAAVMVTGNDFTLFVSNFDLPAPNPDLTKMHFDPPVQIQITLPAAWISRKTTANQRWSYLRYSESPIDNVFAQIKADFAASPGPPVLLPKFAECSVCFTSPLTMAANTTAARQILAANWTEGSNYVGIMQSSLVWKAISSADKSGGLAIDNNGVDHNFSQNGNVITVTIGPNETLVLKP